MEKIALYSISACAVYSGSGANIFDHTTYGVRSRDGLLESASQPGCGLNAGGIAVLKEAQQQTVRERTAFRLCC